MANNFNKGTQSMSYSHGKEAKVKKPWGLA